jgi:lipid A 4'-phosphatase
MFRFLDFIGKWMTKHEETMFMKESLWVDFVLPFFIIVLLTIVLSLLKADLEIEKWFYSPDAGWYLRQKLPWTFLYDYGAIPAFLICLAGFLFFVMSFFQKACLPYRKTGLFLVLVMILGPGLVINTAFKDHWGRPRPFDIVNFGGEGQFRHVWEKGQSGMGKSFPSGHASVGFFLFSPYFILRQRSRKWAVFFLCLGLSYGLLMGLGRMIQGGHFMTDVLWSGYFTYLTGSILSYLFRLNQETDLTTAKAS